MEPITETINKKYAEIEPSANYGPILRGLLNGVKQTAQSFAKIHKLDPEYLEAVMRGEKPLSKEIINAVENHSPLNARALFDPKDRHKLPIRDDTNDGVVVFTARQREATIRTFERGPKDGKKVPFYDYADTAMSKTSAFRPEWIKELYVNSGDDPNVPDWAFNNGHFEYQMTYFIGTVNFHWIDKNGKKHARKMNTGDLNYITPFVPHTFTTRKPGDGLILAVTYGGSVATEQFQSEIKSMELAEYIAAIKQKLPVIEGEILTDELNGVIVRSNKDCNICKTEAYEQKELISGIPNQPSTKAFEYFIKKNSDNKKLDIKVDADRWGYNAGNIQVMLFWKNHMEILEPGSSFFIQPNVAHGFRNLEGEEGKIVAMEIKPEAGNPLKDLALIYKYSGQEGLERVHSETKQWF